MFLFYTFLNLKRKNELDKINEGKYLLCIFNHLKHSSNVFVVFVVLVEMVTVNGGFSLNFPNCNPFDYLFIKAFHFIIDFLGFFVLFFFYMFHLLISESFKIVFFFHSLFKFISFISLD
jgi:hypothetical protein